MRKLTLGKGEPAIQLPILESLIADELSAKVQYAVTGMVYLLLRPLLTADLTLAQYTYIVRATEKYWADCLNRYGDDVKVESKMDWIIRQHLLRQYFVSGLFLDDIRNPKDLCSYMDEVAVLPYLLGKWVVVRSVEEFMQHIVVDSGYEWISFDHDLGEDLSGQEAPSGYDAIKWLVERIMNQKLALPHVLCHSQNPVGKANIMGYWESFLRSLQMG